MNGDQETRGRPGPVGYEGRGLLANLLIGAVAVIGVALLGILFFWLINLESGSKAPDLVGSSYADAVKKANAQGLSIRIDSTQDESSVTQDELEAMQVTWQSPKAGTTLGDEDRITVRLKGLSPMSGRSEAGQPDTETAAPPSAVEQPEGEPSQAGIGGAVICIDPGHSGVTRTGEIDPATGLDVGDNGGAPGELANNWALALKLQARLQAAGYEVRLTKNGVNEYASLRTRADIGNRCSVVVRLHFDPSGFTGVMRPPVGAARCPASDPSRITRVSDAVAKESDLLATHLANALGLSVRNDTVGSSTNNAVPPGYTGALIGSVLSTVPVACIENQVSLVRDNPAGQEQVAAQILNGLNSYFSSRR